MVKRGIFIFLLATGMIQLDAQVISNRVLVPVASTWQGEQYSISQTVGEPVVLYLPGEEWELTQGFQQPLGKGADVPVRQGNGVLVYPNPVSDYMKIEMFGTESIEYHVSIFGIGGSIYFRKDFNCTGSFNIIETLNVSEYKRGIYFVRIETTPVKIAKTFKIEKM